MAQRAQSFERECKQCGLQKDISLFSFYPNTKIRSEVCKSCGAENRRDKKRNTERESLFALPWDQRLRHVQQRRFAQYLRNKYHMSIARYRAMKVEQDNKCAICGVDEKDLNGQLFVDHNHETGAVRGLLCMDCNFALGWFRDNIGSVRNAAEYLKKHDWLV